MTEKEMNKQIEMMQKYYFKEKVDLLNAMKEKFGEGVKDVILRQRAERMKKTWKDIAEKHGSNDCEALLKCLWETMIPDGFEYTYKKAETGMMMDITKCPLADMAKEFNAEYWGYIFYCCDDPNIVEGFNPNMDLIRTKTLMQGDNCCDHFYSMKK